MFSMGYVISFVTALGLIALLIRYAPGLRLVDTPNHRSFHKKLTPKGAGIGFVAAAFFGFLTTEFSLGAEMWYVILAILIVFATGIFDDIKEVSPRFKFITIFAAVLLLYLNDFAMYSLGTYLDVRIDIAPFLVLPLTYFVVVGFTNAMNLIDGIDGLAGTISLIIFATLFAIGVKYGDPLITVLSGMFIASLLAFLVFNWNPAKIFMGDAGSLTLGFTIAVLSVKALEYVNPTVILFITAIPILDTLIVMTRRIQRSQSPFKADKNHMHHLLYKQKRDVRFTTVMLSAIQLLFSMIGYRLIGDDDFMNLMLFGVMFYIFFHLFDPRLRRRKKSKKGQENNAASYVSLRKSA
jgi:UDP-GlcNAc:undecaprenyl-phosphate GlcNAc-1-phosphate transferase